ncbi:MAG: class I SAM-dependent methyltransferase [Dehalococcoidia bacterium]|nr:class I SAM-dependent methyltransferase [Dehalococcoidia bacterium]
MLTVDYKLMEVGTGHRLLDVGCGNGRHTWAAYCLHDCQVLALDMLQEDLQKTRYALYTADNGKGMGDGWLAVRGDAASLPLKSGSFDRVICSEVLEHVADDRRSVAELVRVLKDNGVIAVSVPTRLTESVYWRISRQYSRNPGGHIRIYRAKEIIQLLRDSNLEIFTVRHKHSLHSVYWLLRCIFGVNNEKALVPRIYHSLLVWDLKTRTKPVRLLDDLCNHLFPKSIVIYARKGENGKHLRTA